MREIIIETKTEFEGYIYCIGIEKSETNNLLFSEVRHDTYSKVIYFPALSMKRIWEIYNDVKNKNLMCYFALSFATKQHINQLDKGGNSYIYHPQFVGNKFNDQCFKTVGFLHDVVEDTKVSMEEIRNCFPKIISDAVKAITKVKGEDDTAYYCRIKGNNIAIQVKMQDLLHNANISRLNVFLPSDEQCDKCIFYLKQYKELKNYWNKSHPN